MQYEISVQLGTGDSITSEPFATYYNESTANNAAKRESRKMSSPSALFVITTNKTKRGYPKVYRMGRLYRP